ncbi:hypothetical protein [Rhizobium sp. Rhizsp82]|uniref:hypothetical protein n=1 Tax=Rhizobium sp. Rhizsp82 TaxID=3243057 RepID=UPI0039B4DF00
MLFLELLRISAAVFLAILVGGTLGGKIGGGPAWKSAIAVFVGVPLSVVVFFLMQGRGSPASLIAGQVLVGVTFTWLIGWTLGLRFYPILGMLIGGCAFGAVALKVCLVVIAARDAAPY